MKRIWNHLITVGFTAESDHEDIVRAPDALKAMERRLKELKGLPEDEAAEAFGTSLESVDAGYRYEVNDRVVILQYAYDDNVETGKMREVYPGDVGTIKSVTYVGPDERLSYGVVFENGCWIHLGDPEDLSEWLRPAGDTGFDNEWICTEGCGWSSKLDEKTSKQMYYGQMARACPNCGPPTELRPVQCELPSLSNQGEKGPPHDAATATGMYDRDEG